MKKIMKSYEFFYSVMSEVTTNVTDRSFSCESDCLKSSLIKFAGHLASFSDFDIGRYHISSQYLVDDKYKELSSDDHFFCQFYIQYFRGKRNG